MMRFLVVREEGLRVTYVSSEPRNGSILRATKHEQAQYVSSPRFRGERSFDPQGTATRVLVARAFVWAIKYAFRAAGQRTRDM